MRKVKKSKLALRLAKKGRRGDTILAHINPQEAMMLKAMGGSGGMNPETGLPEFNDDSDDGMGESSSDGYGGGVESGYDGGYDSGGWSVDPPDQQQNYYGYDFSPDQQFAAQMGIDQQRDARSNYVSDRGIGANNWGDLSYGGNLSDYIGFGFDRATNNISRGIQDMMDNPVRTAANIGFGFTPLGGPNMISGMLGGPTLGDPFQSAYNYASDKVRGRGQTTAPVDGMQSTVAQAPGAPGTPGVYGYPGQPDLIANSEDPFLSQYGVPTPGLNPHPVEPVATVDQPADWGRLTFDPARNNYFYSGAMGQG